MSEVATGSQPFVTISSAESAGAGDWVSTVPGSYPMPRKVKGSGSLRPVLIKYPLGASIPLAVFWKVRSVWWKLA